MVLNKKGQAVFYLLMLGIVIFIFALATAPALKQFVSDAKAPSTNESVGLDCSNSSISDFDKANCIGIDLNTPYFFFVLLGIAGMVFLAKVVAG